jgi:hypothetical protein
MSVLQKVFKATTLQESDFAGWAPKDLFSLATAVSSAVDLQSQKARDYVQNNGYMQIPDVAFLQRLATLAQLGQGVKVGNTAEKAFTSGHRVETANEAEIVHHLDGKTEVFKHDVCHFEGKSHLGEDVLFSVLSVFVQKKGIVSTQASPRTWADSFKQSPLVDSPSATGLGSLLQLLLEADPVWKKKTLHDKQQITGMAWQEFLRVFLRRMDLSDYFVLHHYVCTTLLKLVNPTCTSLSSRLGYSLAEHVRLYPIKGEYDQSLKIAFGKVASALPGIKNVPVLVKYLTVPSLVPEAASLKLAISSNQKAVAWRGGDSSPLGLLTSSFGWTLQTTEKIRRVSLVCAIINGLFETQKDVDIQTPSSGDYLLIHHTLKAYKSLTGHLGEWKFVEPNVSKVDRALRPFVIVARRPSAHFFMWSEESFVSKSEATVSEYYRDTNDFKEAYVGNFTVWKTIVTEYWWKKERKNTSKSFQMEGWLSDGREFFVYSYGFNADFQGLVSTVPVKLETVPVNPTKLDILAKVVTSTHTKADLKLHSTSESWYANVIASNNARNNAWLTGIRKVTNLISGIVPASAGVMWRNEFEQANSQAPVQWRDTAADNTGWVLVKTPEGPKFVSGTVHEESDEEVESSEEEGEQNVSKGAQIILEGDCDLTQQVSFIISTVDWWPAVYAKQLNAIVEEQSTFVGTDGIFPAFEQRKQDGIKLNVPANPAVDSLIPRMARIIAQEVLKDSDDDDNENNVLEIKMPSADEGYETAKTHVLTAGEF